MWKIEPGKADCLGNVSWWRVYRADDYWTAHIVTGQQADARALVAQLNATGAN